MALQGIEILSVNSLNKLKLFQLDSGIAFFANKIPQLKNALDGLSIDSAEPDDIKKLAGTQLKLPGLTQAVLAGPSVEMSVETRGIPLANLSFNALGKIPSDIVFARTAGELIDLGSVISVDKQGYVQQKISTISGKPMQFVIKPDKPANRITGLVFLDKLNTAQNSKNGFARFFSAALAIAVPQVPAENSASNALLIQKFNYLEEQPGVFKAEINAPIKDGKYKIVTVIEYKDALLAPAQTQLFVEVDPEGYVYSETLDGRVRIKNAEVSLYQLNQKTEKYELWDAGKFLQKNPVYTNETGKYSFLVPEGKYYLSVKAKNYIDYKSDVFAVQGQNGVNVEVAMRKKTLLPQWLNWQMTISVLLGAIFLVLCILLIFIIKTKQKFK